ncbi:uncharacterized protein LOC123878215 isoform X2 [Maniola jurtina]|uniref:uncharacterized protein LOC123878215 isoform X2 n=1 Tax=Maniola jurtina TaxID=191418 RepID=UPI001E68D876|nr:uncharacterized protein LOC123878215 isoform X2 [Maniola jurtina]
MNQFPLKELKRRLSDDAIPLPKRIRLARNVLQSHHFPTVPQERVVAEWVNDLIHGDKITSRGLKDILDWLNGDTDFTNELKYKIIKVVTRYLHSSTLHDKDIGNIILFLTNKKTAPQLNCLPDEFLFITKTLLKTLHPIYSENIQKIQTILNNIIDYYKGSKKKVEFIGKFMFGECIEQIISYLKTECHSAVINVCQNILFPLTKKQTFAHFFNHMIKTDNVDEISSDKSENMQIVVTIMRGFFTFPNGRVQKDPKFLNCFINIFVSCFRNESRIIFAFYIMAASVLNMPQNYLIPAMKMPPIMFVENDDKIKRTIFLNMLEVLLKNEVDITVRLTDTIGEKISKVEIKKTFMSFLQTLMLGQLKLEGKMDKTTLKIITTAIKLDPSLVEQKMDQILPHIMTATKNNADFLNSYIEMMNCLLETLFKLSHGTDFLNQMIPHLKLSLEASNIEQFELKQKLKEATNNITEYFDEIKVETIKAKIITGKDIFPPECVEMYGKLTSELLFRQSKDLLVSLQKDFEESCLMMLEEGFVSPSIITLAETLAAILSSVLRHSKMADHTVPQNIAEEFWAAFQNFEDQCLNKFGECILKLNYNPVLVLAFLKLNLSFSHLKLLNLKYSNTKLKIVDNNLLPFLCKEKWISFASKIQEEEANLIWIQILLTKTMTIELLSTDNTDEHTSNLLSETKTNIIKQISDHPQILAYDNYITSNLFRNLDRNQSKQLSKLLLKSGTHDPDMKIFNTNAITGNKVILQTILLKVTKNICDCIENTSVLSKALSKTNFDVTSFTKEVNIKEYFYNTLIQNQDVIENLIEVLKQLQIHYMEENYQLTAIFVLLITKKCCQTKKLRKKIDYILQSIYELSPKYPDLYKIFSVDFIFDFDNNTLIDLLKLTNKTPNNTLVLKSVLETAVKKVKTDSEIVKNIVEILLTNHKSKGTLSSIEYFKEPVFQIICIILPLIAREKKAITTSAYRSILANLQEKLNKAMLDSFKNIDFSKNSSFLVDEAGSTDDSVVVSENTVATLNAMGAYTLTLLKYCESNDGLELKNMECVLLGLELFVQRAIQAIENPSSKNQHIEISIHLINVTLRYIKKLEAHTIFKDKDKLFHEIWLSIKSRLLLIFSEGGKGKVSSACFDEIAIVLKFLAELSSVECFSTHFVGDLANLALLKKPSIILKNTETTNQQLTARKVSKYLWQNCLKANIIELKCVAMTKLIARTTRNIKFWMQQHYDCVQNGGKKDINQDGDQEMQIEENTSIGRDESLKILKIDDSICELLRYDLDILSEVILAAKKDFPGLQIPRFNI